MAVNWGSFDSDVVKEIEGEYKRYGKFGDDSFHGDNITLRNVDKWLTDAGIIGEKEKLTTNDTSIAFKRILSNEQKTMPFDKFKDYLSDLAQTANPSNPGETLKDFIGKLRQKKAPTKNDTTTPDKSDVVERLTDPANFTGTQRFAADGKAVDGKEIADQETTKNDGYVQGYKNKGTYDKDNDVKEPKYDAEKQQKRDDNIRSTDASSDPSRNATANELRKDGKDQDKSKHNADMNRQMSEPSRTETVSRSAPDPNSHAIDHRNPATNPRAQKTDLKEAEASREGYSNAAEAQDDRAKNQNKDQGQINAEKRDARPTPANKDGKRDVEEGSYNRTANNNTNDRSSSNDRNDTRNANSDRSGSRPANDDSDRNNNDRSARDRSSDRDNNSNNNNRNQQDSNRNNNSNDNSRDQDKNATVRDQVDRINKNISPAGRDVTSTSQTKMNTTTGKSPARGADTDTRAGASDGLPGPDRTNTQNTPSKQTDPSNISQDKAHAANQQRDIKTDLADPGHLSRDYGNNQTDTEKNNHTIGGHRTASTVPGNAGNQDDQKNAADHAHHTTHGRTEAHGATGTTESSQRDTTKMTTQYDSEKRSERSQPQQDSYSDRNADLLMNSSARSGAPVAKDNARIANEQVRDVAQPRSHTTTGQQETRSENTAAIGHSKTESTKAETRTESNQQNNSNNQGSNQGGR